MQRNREQRVWRKIGPAQVKSAARDTLRRLGTLCATRGARGSGQRSEVDFRVIGGPGRGGRVRVYHYEMACTIGVAANEVARDRIVRILVGMEGLSAEQTANIIATPQAVDPALT